MKKQRTLTTTIEDGLKAMNVWYNWQIGSAFAYYKDRVGKALCLKGTENLPEYNNWRTQYDTIIKRAKDSGLIT